jgi:hypothetical protein
MARGKSITHFCRHCERETKMEMIGNVESQPEKIWYRCIRCRHASLLDLAEWKRTQEEAKRKVVKSECLEYRPELSYSVGQAIFHSGLDDMGRIISKERTSDGAYAIVVSFEKAGERRLLEKVVDNPQEQSWNK